MGSTKSGEELIAGDRNNSETTTMVLGSKSVGIADSTPAQ